MSTTATDKVYKDRNARRRARYASDEAYRQSIIERERQKRNTVTFDCRENLPKLASIGNVRPILTDDGAQVGEGLTFTIEEAARALGRTPKSLYKYFARELFPRPNKRVKGPTGILQEAYTEQQMRSLISVFGKHQAETPYYGVYHVETKDALHKCV